MMYGASQFVRSPPPPPRPPPPPAPPPRTTAASGPGRIRPTAGSSRRGWRVVRTRHHVRAARTHRLVLTGAQIHPRYAAGLTRRVDDVRIARLDAGLEAVAAAGHPPVAHPDADAVHRPRRSALRLVVLCAAADVVERQRVVHGDAIELRDRQVVEVPPRFAFVPRLVRAAVVADHDVVLVLRVHPHRVEVHVDAVHVRHARPALAAVTRPLEVRVGRPNRVVADRVDEDFLVVAGIAAAVCARRAAAASTTSAATTSATGAATRSALRCSRGSSRSCCPAAPPAGGAACAPPRAGAAAAAAAAGGVAAGALPPRRPAG